MKRLRSVKTCCLALALCSGLVAGPSSAAADTTLTVQASGSGVTATGIYTQNGVPLSGVPALLTVLDTHQNIEYADQLKTDATGHYRFAWTMPNSAAAGTYTVEVHINGDVQTAAFQTYANNTGSDTILPVALGPYRFTGELNSGSKQAVIYDTNSGLVVNSTGNDSSVTLDPYKAASTIAAADPSCTYLTVSVPTHDLETRVTVPGSLLKQAEQKFGSSMHLLVAAEKGSYDLPLAAVNSALLDSVMNSADGALQLQIGLADSVATSSIRQQETSNGAQELVPPVEFSLQAQYGGQSIPIRDFGGSYVRCSIDLTGATLNSSQVPSAFFLDPTREQLQPTPAKLYHDAVGYGKLVIARTGNGVYSPVQAFHTFADVWGNPAQTQIEQLASKSVISGKTSTLFDPNGHITRAEFSTLMVRALGLSDKEATSLFADVAPNSWYGRYVAIGSSLGLISGYSNEQFAPNDPITREQMAALLARSVEFVQTKPYVDTTRILGQVQDRSQISSWARDDVALAIATGIVNPNTTTFAPQRLATRAESAVMLDNLLTYLQLM